MVIADSYLLLCTFDYFHFLSYLSQELAEFVSVLYIKVLMNYLTFVVLASLLQ